MANDQQVAGAPLTRQPMRSKSFAPGWLPRPRGPLGPGSYQPTGGLRHSGVDHSVGIGCFVRGGVRVGLGHLVRSPETATQEVLSRRPPCPAPWSPLLDPWACVTVRGNATRTRQHQAHPSARMLGVACNQRRGSWGHMGHSHRPPYANHWQPPATGNSCTGQHCCMQSAWPGRTTGTRVAPVLAEGRGRSRRRGVVRRHGGVASANVGTATTTGGALVALAAPPNMGRVVQYAHRAAVQPGAVARTALVSERPSLSSRLLPAPGHLGAFSTTGGGTIRSTLRSTQRTIIRTALRWGAG